MSYINVKISEDILISMFAERLRYWAKDWSDEEFNLFIEMYQSYIDSCVFEDIELDIINIVDNDVSNYCQILYINDFDDEEEFKRAIKTYNEGYRDVSCDGFDFSFIEAINENKGLILVRY